MNKTKVGISACLLGERVRYDGGHKLDPFLKNTLSQFIEFVPICPESEAGLGVPREAMRLAGDPQAPGLVTIKTGIDHTERMMTWAARRVLELENEGLSGFIFKSRSPSCGMENVKVYPEGGTPVEKGVGLFARFLMQRFPLLRVEDEGGLQDAAVRNKFIGRILKQEGVRKKLLAWYKESKRDLPWRKTRDPYRIWISEIMLQQTQVDTVVPYYLRFLKRFPDVRALAAAGQADVLKTWENLGYYSRARNLHRAARIIAEKHGNVFPETPCDISALPGVGAYTTGAILSIAFSRRIPAIDGNVKRVLARLYALQAPLAERETLRAISVLAETLVPMRNPGDFNQAIMDLGAAICLPAHPLCGKCPIRINCRSFQYAIQDKIPSAVKKKPPPLRHATAALIPDRNNRFLIIRRSDNGLLGGMWKLPGGFQRAGETLPSALERTVFEETGIVLDGCEPIAAVNHAFTHFRMKLHGFHCRSASERPRILKGIDFRWIDLSQMSRFAFGKADREMIHKLSAVGAAVKRRG